MDKAFKIVIPGVDGGGAQIFQADSQEELVEQLKTAQENATSKIRELAQNNEALAAQVNNHSPQVPTNGDNQQFFQSLYQNPDDAIIGVLERRIGMKIEDFKKDYNQTRLGSQKAIQNEVNATFVQKHPELLQVSQEDDISNSTIISQILTENGWQYNYNNLEAAYAVARTQGKLKLPNENGLPEVVMQSAPSTLTRPTGAVNSSESLQHFLNTAPLSKVKEYFEKGEGSRA